jgi:hypothetical protein
VLIEGETGVGKELSPAPSRAWATGPASPSSPSTAAPFPPTWSSRPSSATGRAPSPAPRATSRASSPRRNGGTLFLDEIGELPLDAGEAAARHPGGRNRAGRRDTPGARQRADHLGHQQTAAQPRAAGDFREDLYYRLNVFPIYVPPLRDRPEDIALLTSHFIARLAAEAGKRIAGISETGARPAARLQLAGQHPAARERRLSRHRPVGLGLSRNRRLPADRRPDLRARRGGAAAEASADALRRRFTSTPPPPRSDAGDARGSARPLPRRQGRSLTPSPMSNAN